MSGPGDLGSGGWTALRDVAAIVVVAASLAAAGGLAVLVGVLLL